MTRVCHRQMFLTTSDRRNDSFTTPDCLSRNTTITRAEEDEIDRNDPSRGKVRLIDIIFPPKRGPGVQGQLPTALASAPDEEKRRSSVNANLAVQATRAVITDEEWKNASRALRTATWAACFYLITTDILGPFGVGFSMGTLEWGPGIVLFTAFGLMAG